jgi:hypothetical protein
MSTATHTLTLPGRGTVAVARPTGSSIPDMAVPTPLPSPAPGSNCCPGPVTSRNWRPQSGSCGRYAQFDLGQAVMAMTLAAADLGIGSSHAGIRDLPLARELLGFPEDRDWAMLVSLGYPADRPLSPIRNPKRRPFIEVVHRGGW